MSFNQSYKPTLLVVDDEPGNVKLIINALGNQNYHIRVASNGVKALEIIFASQPPDLILLKTVLPDVDGYHVCQEIKQHNKYQNIPIIFLYSREEDIDVDKGLSLGAVDYLSRPFNDQLLKVRVNNHLELKIKSDLLERYASIDKLTNIPNRNHFDDKLNNEWHRCLRTESPMSLIIMDIDCFKAFNDNYGQTTGDQCLRQIAKALCEKVKRPGDVIARYDGEKFVAILPTTDKQGALKIALDLQSAIKFLNIIHEYSDTSSIITLSFGVATTVATNETSPEQLIVQAETLLISAKKAGKNTIKHSEYTP